MPPVRPYIDSSPFLTKLRWPQYLVGKDICDLQELGALPDKAEDLWTIRQASQALFHEHQNAIEGGNLAILKGWMQKAWAPHGATFDTVTPGTILKYSNRMTALICFFLRMSRRLESDEHLQNPKFFTCRLSTLQRELCGEIWDLIADGEVPTASRLHSLLMSCFTPDLDEFTLHLQTLDDPVHVFCMVSAIDKAGQFKGPERLTSPNAALQYLFRSTIHYHIHATCSEGQVSQRAKTYRDKYLNEDELSPFANLLALKHLTSTHAKATARLPTVNWIDEQQLTVKGKLVIVDDLKRFSRGIIPELRSFLHNVLLFGLPLKEHYHWAFDRNTKLVDDFSRRDPGYSVFSDCNNKVFAGKDQTLYRTVITHPEVKKQFYAETNDAKIPIFFTNKQQQWLDHYMEFVSKIAIAMHALGGQPGRGNEIIIQFLFNLVHKLRTIYWFGSSLIFVLFYNKVTVVSGKDRVIAHGIPWELTELLVPLIVLVRPLAVEWVRQLYGADAAKIQGQCLFAQYGQPFTSTKFSRLLQNMTGLQMGVQLTVSDWRHLMIAVMRKLFRIKAKVPPEEEDFEEEDDGSEDEEHIQEDNGEQQAGHLPATGREHYAVLEAREWNMLSDDTTKKWVQASRQTYQWLLTSPLDNPRRSQKEKALEDEFVPESPAHIEPGTRLTLQSSKKRRMVFDCVELPAPKQTKTG
ncbi:hypothetical protein FRC10_004613 [Ceratobasidium sp. 414]|nr:hypothetical protein FRC10_004613 [Ceratobasidium sp. 414]